MPGHPELSVLLWLTIRDTSFGDMEGSWEWEVEIAVCRAGSNLPMTTEVSNQCSSSC